MSVISQKDYLRKYLRIGKETGEKKKKKKGDKTFKKGLKIIDDDVDMSISQEIQDDLEAGNEDAPQIVAVIDERPPSLRIDEQTKSNLWQPIGETTKTLPFQSFKMSSIKLNINKDFDKRKDKYKSNSTNRKISRSSPTKEGLILNNDLSLSQKLDKDYSPIRSSYENHSLERNKRDSDQSPRRKNDYSPSRKREETVRGKNEDYSPPRKRETIKGKNEDYSPSRKRKETYKSKNEGYSPSRKGKETDRSKNEDYSPLRKRKETDRSKNEDYSPLRKRKETDRSKNEDYSSPRKRDISSVINRKDISHTSPRKVDDNSPTRKKRDVDISPPRKQDFSKKTNRNPSPPRNNRSEDQFSSRINDDDYSPPRKPSNTNHSSTVNDQSPVRIEKDSSSQRKNKKSRWGEEEDIKPEKTMSGKKAGLQAAKTLADDIIQLQKQEEEMFKTMPAAISGANAATVVRKTKKQDIPDPEKERRERELKEKYSHWGKGVKQVQDEHEKMADQLKEMNKPLARYADDEDLEKHLKEQEREGDPMLAYIRKKKKKVAVEKGIPEKPTYMGDFMPNRFGIIPGYRWDGVDRSNGYEQKWFQVQNSKKAMQDEALQWSQEDM